MGRVFARYYNCPGNVKFVQYVQFGFRLSSLKPCSTRTHLVFPKRNAFPTSPMRADRAPQPERSSRRLPNGSVDPRCRDLPPSSVRVHPDQSAVAASCQADCLTPLQRSPVGKHRLPVTIRVIFNPSAVQWLPAGNRL